MPAKATGGWDDLQGFLNGVAAIEELENGHKEPVVAAEKEAPVEPKVVDTRRSEAVAVDIDRPTPPFWGTKLLQPADLPWDEVFWHMDLQALIAGQWQFRKLRRNIRLS